MTEADFLTALAASPDDALLVSAYANFLEERSDPRAQYVRDDVIRPFLDDAFADPYPAILVALATRVRIRAAMRACVNLGPPAALVLADALVEAAHVGRRGIRLVLRKMRQSARAALPRLTPLLRHPDLDLRMAASRILEVVTPEAGADTEPYFIALGDHQADVGRAAAKALRSLVPGRDAVRKMRSMLRSESVDVRVRAVRSLASLGTISAFREVAAAQEDEVIAVRAAAAKALRSAPRRFAVGGPILRSLTDADPFVREETVVSLRVLRREWSAPVVTALARVLEDATVWGPVAAAQALGDLGTAAASALPALRRVTGANDPALREVARLSIRQIESAIERTEQGERLSSAEGNESNPHHSIPEARR